MISQLSNEGELSLKPINTKPWKPSSYKEFTMEQQPLYEDTELKDTIINQIKKHQTSLCYNEINLFKDEIQEVFEGKRFILQIGDCAELFEEMTEQSLKMKFQLLENCAKTFQGIVSINTLLLGRLCGQFCKPRSQPFEDDGTPSYRGDLINSFDKENRTPDPQRLLLATDLQVKSVNFLKRYVENTEQKIWTSHECLHLDWESAFVRQEQEKYYSSSGHFLWVGERTRNSQHAHINFVSGIQNTIGLKVSSKIDENEFIKLTSILNPDNLTNKLVIITRIGVKLIQEFLPKLIQWKKNHNLNLVWICDPMHGNTKNLNRTKTRFLSDIKDEIKHFILILKQNQEKISGIHLEATPYEVLECLKNESDDADTIVYTSVCDPRLNSQQTKEIIEYTANLIQNLNIVD